MDSESDLVEGFSSDTASMYGGFSREARLNSLIIAAIPWVATLIAGGW
jgi:hypothetical protein